MPWRGTLTVSGCACHQGVCDDRVEALRARGVRQFVQGPAVPLLGLPFTAERVDLFKGAGQHPDYLAISAMGQVPALVDGGDALRDSQAILFYLARTRGNGRWLADDPLGQARTIAWLSFAANEMANGPAALRVAARFKRPVNIDWATAVTQRAFKLMQATLSGQPWLMPGDHPSIADVACFPYAALAHEGNVSIASTRRSSPGAIACAACRVRRHGGRLAGSGARSNAPARCWTSEPVSRSPGRRSRPLEPVRRSRWPPARDLPTVREWLACRWRCTSPRSGGPGARCATTCS